MRKNLTAPFLWQLFFEGPTVEKLAATLGGDGIVLNWNWLVGLQPVGSNPPLFLLHGNWELAHQIGADQPIYGARPHGLDGRRVPLSVQEMAADYLAELRTIQAEGPYFIGGGRLEG